MSERTLTPAVHTSTDHLLTLRSDLLSGKVPRHMSEDQYLSGKLAAAHHLSTLPGAELSENDDHHVLAIPVSEFPRDRDGQLQPALATELVRGLRFFVPYNADTSVDRVIGITPGGGYGPGATVYRSFQDWLNDTTIDEQRAAEVLTAMSEPLFTKVRSYKQKFDDLDEYGVIARKGPVEIVIHDEKFSHKASGKGVAWKSVRLVTLGDSTELSVDASERENALDLPHNAKLYDMTPSNVDHPWQTISFVMGLGALARLATERD